MPKIPWAPKTDRAIFEDVWTRTNKIVKMAMVEQDVPSVKKLAALLGMEAHTVSDRLCRRAQWKHEEICKVVRLLHIAPEDAVKMLGC